MELVLIASNRILRGSEVVSPAAGLNFASKFCDRPKLMVCCGSLRAFNVVSLGSSAWAYAESTVAPGAY